MLKLLFWIVVGGAIYLFYQGRQRLNAQQEAELEAKRRTQNSTIIDVEAEDITAQD